MNVLAVIQRPPSLFFKLKSGGISEQLSGVTLSYSDCVKSVWRAVRWGRGCLVKGLVYFHPLLSVGKLGSAVILFRLKWGRPYTVLFLLTSDGPLLAYQSQICIFLPSLPHFILQWQVSIRGGPRLMIQKTHTSFLSFVLQFLLLLTFLTAALFRRIPSSHDNHWNVSSFWKSKRSCVSILESLSGF